MLLFNAVHPRTIGTLVRTEEIAKGTVEEVSLTGYPHGEQRV